jgi:hypothetical protein
MQNLLEILGDQQTDFGALFLKNDVGRDGRSVKKRGDIRRRDACFLDQLLDPVEDPDRLIAGRRRRLQKAHGTRALVEQEEVRKSTTDVNAEPVTHINPCGGRFRALLPALKCNPIPLAVSSTGFALFSRADGRVPHADFYQKCSRSTLIVPERRHIVNSSRSFTLLRNPALGQGF